MSSDDIRNTLETQVEDLRKQLKHITSTLSEQGLNLDELREGAEEGLHGVGRSAQRAVRHAQDEAEAVFDVARKAPAATTTALTIAGALGFLVGYLVATSQHEDSKHHPWRRLKL
ncbi:hypothetical protein [Pelagibacterium montanilacus]|uniref:hypothetical protein n=1 Tax=Pelagibacterium montanilacus TaxID=2185280 RepID=UPI000F8CDDD9|nr:hypothetical protein [Pelagibacterium montanilacus]